MIHVDDRRLPAATKLLLAVAILRSYILVRRSLSRFGLEQTLSAAREGTVSPKVRITGESRYVAWKLTCAVQRVLDRVPGGSKCLARSLVLTAMLASREIESVLVIGVSADGGFAAHAWVEVDDFPLLPAYEADYARLVAL